MDKVYIESALRPEGHYSPAVSDGKYIYVSGQLPIDPFTGEACRGGVAEQTRRVLENIRLVLRAAGSSPEKVLRSTVYVSDIGHWDEVYSIFAVFFGAHRPARSIVPVSRLHHGFEIEMDAIAEV